MKTLAKILWAIALAIFALILVASCSQSSEETNQEKPESEAKPTLSEVFCSDLKNEELSLYQIYAGSKDRFDGPQDFADYAYGAAAISCPEELKNNEFFRGYLMDWGINPDA
jgi:hypothetical protein